MKTITVETIINKNIEETWENWVNPAHITKWNFASDDWECPSATNELKVGGRFNYRMQAKDGSSGFDFTGTYKKIKLKAQIDYVMDGEDKRKVSIVFEQVGKNQTKVTETFDREYENSIELQRFGWQTILDNFKKHVEA